MIKFSYPGIQHVPPLIKLLFNILVLTLTSLVAQTVKRPPTMWETRVQFLGQEDLLEKETAIHSSILAWKIPWTRGSWRATIHGVTKSQTQLTTHVLCCVLAQLAQRVKHLPAKQETQVRFLGWEDPLEKETAIHSSILAWETSWIEKPGGLWAIVHGVAKESDTT